MTHVRSFRAARGARFSDEDAQRYGVFLDMHGAAERPLDAEEIVKISRPKRAATHRYVFNNTDEEAAHEYRLDRARELGRMICVVVEEAEADDDDEVVTRAFFHVKAEPRKGQKDGKEGYVSSSVVFSDDYLAQQAISQAKAELYAWRNKYAQYTALADLIQSIDEWLGEDEEQAA